MIQLMCLSLAFNLRQDAFGKLQHNANSLNNWFLERIFVPAPVQQLTANYLTTMKEFASSQSPGSFSLQNVQKTIEDSMGGNNKVESDQAQ